ncbi:MAG: hypothetical protein E7426_03385 [Ruminococcaceae bacterium]|nr:hypothetical protein [Oscillospiraceae bacterium]
MQKRVFSNELAYVLGLIIMGLGNACMERADFGMAMVVTPAYILHLKISQTLPWFTFGVSEYLLQGVVLLSLILVMKRFKLSYLYSFLTAVLYGYTLDAAMLLVRLLPGHAFGHRLVFYAVGALLCAMGVSLLFHTYISPEAYELFVKEVSGKLGMDIHRFKTLYDCLFCAIGIILSFTFFGLWHFEGVKAGTIVFALINGSLIGLFSRLFERWFFFQDTLPWRRYF